MVVDFQGKYIYIYTCMYMVYACTPIKIPSQVFIKVHFFFGSPMLVACFEGTLKMGTPRLGDSPPK